MVVSAAAGLVLAGIAGIGAWLRMTRLIRTALTTTGLTVAGAMLVHFSHGYIESHFHFFVAMAFIALYQDWRPFLLAFFLIVAHHGIIGMLAPMAVYSHPHAVAHPWMWATIHGGAILAEGLGLLLYWQCNEDTSAQLRPSPSTPMYRWSSWYTRARRLRWISGEPSPV